jgi:hypothetical protein
MDCKLLDLGATGSKFTWRGPIFDNGVCILERLDRALSNDSWRVLFPNAIVQTLPHVEFSDHHPLLLNLSPMVDTHVERPFRFESAWQTHDSFQSDLSMWWSQRANLTENLNKVEDALKEWRINTFGSVRKRKRDVLARLGGIQRKREARAMNCHLDWLESMLQKELAEVLRQEELMWHQRSRAKWLYDGDRNTKYYHVKAVNRKRKNKIIMLRNNNGQWVEDDSSLRELVTNYYKDLFAETNENLVTLDMKYGFKPLEDEVAHNIDIVVQNDEIGTTLFEMGAWKALGPDGYPAGFYQKNWSIVAPKMYDFVKHIWLHPENIASVNTTNICLIPKVDKPEFVSQFRPISLCNVSYKVLTKVIVNRLKPLIPLIISPYQTGFIPTRSIHENIVVAQEMIHSMLKMRGRTGYVAVKVDLAKAYDRLRWSFISAVLEEVNLPQGLRRTIMHCITSVKTNVMWHGSRSEYFNPRRGIRQGDPMSPYIFVLCMDKLTHLIAEAVDSGKWQPLRAGRSGPNISHLMFADDLLLFGKATEENMKAITDTLNAFCDLSGQLVSLEKTSILFSKNVSQATREGLLHQSGFREATSLGKYLGIPLIGRAPRRNDFEYLVNKVRSKLSGWKTTHLSFAGRVTLAKSVIQSIPIYSMMTIPIPKSVFMDIHRLQRNFIWGHEDGQRKMHMINWDTLLLPKESGGLAIRHLPTMNTACLMKLGWSMREGNESLWCKVLKGKYGRNSFENSDFVAKPADSFIWKGVVQSWVNIRQFEEWSVGNGNVVHAWRDKWLGSNITLAQHMDSIPTDVSQWTVADMVNESGNWTFCLRFCLWI